MDSRSNHLLLELHRCDQRKLNDSEFLESVMEQAALIAGARVVGRVFHRFSPHGVTGVLVVEESHFSVHTWPESGYAAVDFFTCGTCHPELAIDHIASALGAERSDLLWTVRGLEAIPSLEVAPVKTTRHSRGTEPEPLAPQGSQLCSPTSSTGGGD